MSAESRDRYMKSSEHGMRERITNLYDSIAAVMSRMPEHVAAGADSDLKRMRRLVQYLIDMVIDDEPLLLCMALNRDRYAYEYRHPVNVCILSVKLGYKIGLSKNELAELGLVSLLYDVSRHFIPADVRHKAGRFEAADWEAMGQHPTKGFRALFNLNSEDEQVLRAAIVAFEHHLRYDLSGYPRVRHLASQDFYTRIISIAEWYDALTATRSYATGHRSPDYAVRTLFEKSGTELDPVLVKLFVSMMGIYPIGSLVVLDSGEMGIVVQPHGVLLKRPRVLVLSDSVKPFIADLSKRGDEGRYLRSVMKTLDPNDYKIDYSTYFFNRSRKSADI